MSQRKLK